MNAFELKIPDERLRVVQIVAAALPMGAFLFLAIVAGVIHPPQAPYNFQIDLMEMIFLGQVLILVPASFLIPQTVLRSNATRVFKDVDLQAEIELESTKDEPPKRIGQFMDLYTTQMIIGSALLEGAALFGIVTYFIDQSIIALIVAGILVLFLFARIPTRTKVQNSLAKLANELEFTGGRQI